MAKGSRRSLAAAPAAAAVVSEAMIEPRKTPWSQSKDWWMRGTVEERRPPTRMASIGTPFGSSHSGAMAGSWAAGAVKRALGWAAGVGDSGFQGWPFQSVARAGGSSVMPSHQMSPASVSAVLVKMQLPSSVRMALGFVFIDVPGATPKNPASGLIAHNRPCSSGVIHAISSPTVVTFHPLNASGGTIIAKLVFPHELGKAAAT